MGERLLIKFEIAWHVGFFGSFIQIKRISDQFRNSEIRLSVLFTITSPNTIFDNIFLDQVESLPFD